MSEKFNVMPLETEIGVAGPRGPVGPKGTELEVSATGTSTNKVKYITIDNTESGGSSEEYRIDSDVNDVQVNGTSIVDNGIANVEFVDNVISTDINKGLSANQGKVLQDEIDNLKSIGRFLSLWNPATGLPTSEPPVLPYTYKTGDWYRVKITTPAEVYYKPSGSSYTGEASEVVETDTQISDTSIYFYDGTTWVLELNENDNPSIIIGYTVPTTSTVAKKVGDIYIGTIDSVVRIWDCIAIIADVYTWRERVRDITRDGVSIVNEGVAAFDQFTGYWNPQTGKPEPEPSTLPYTYKTGDCYRVRIPEGYTGTMYRPSGRTYTGEQSTTIETETITNNSIYIYDYESDILTAWMLEPDITIYCQ